MSDWNDYLLANSTRFLDELLDFIRIPSISSLPEHRADVEQAAEWVAERLTRAGIENVSVMQTGGHPIVYGDWLHAPGKPTVLIYGHFDTQPVDPLELWTHPPFEPHVDGDRIYARGASDDKGNMLVPILAVEALLQSAGELPLNIKFFFEGQEEIGSPQLPAFIEANRELVACDLCISADGGQWEEDQPALLVGLRGLAAVEIDVIGANSDLHSGMYGGAVQNPLHALVAILDSMRGPDGVITVEGFYDAVQPLTAQERAQIAAVPFNESEIRSDLEIDAFFGEAGYTPLERIWARPTLEVNGMWGGFQGEGIKTVLPNTAHAKISCRLVLDQDPEEIVRLITAHVEKHTPAGIRVTVTPEASSAQPYLMPSDHPALQVARAVHQELYGVEPFYVRIGGSIPFCYIMLQNVGVYTLGFAFGLDDENAHAPDEFFRISSFKRGQRGYILLLQSLSEATL